MNYTHACAQNKIVSTARVVGVVRSEAVCSLPPFSEFLSPDYEEVPTREKCFKPRSVLLRCWPPAGAMGNASFLAACLRFRFMLSNGYIYIYIYIY